MRRVGVVLALAGLVALGGWGSLFRAFATGQAAPSPSNLIVNGGFENGLTGWTLAGTPTPGLSSNAHSGAHSALLGQVQPAFGSFADNQISQTVDLPAGASPITLSYWYDSTCNGRALMRVTLAVNGQNTLLQSGCVTTSGWTESTFSLSSYAGDSVSLVFEDTVSSTGEGQLLVDDVAITTPQNSTSTPTSQPSVKPTATGTALPATSTATVAPTNTATVNPISTSTPGPAPTETAGGPGPPLISIDPFASPTVGQHRSEVEPDTFSHGATVVSAFQVGRIYDGGSTDIGWATRIDSSWQHGLLPSLTVSATPPGPWDRASDPSVAYDAAAGMWLISSLVLSGSTGSGVVVSRSPNGWGWSAPYTVSSGGGYFYDKDWIACDNSATSRYYGHCYAEWDDNTAGDEALMATSTDGGKTWSAAIAPAGNPSGVGGQPVVQPDGTVIVPILSGYGNAIIAFSSTDGGATWGNVVTVSGISVFSTGGDLRTIPLPSAEIDAGGRVYVVWQDCRFEAGCSANDIVMSTSTDGINWSSVVRIPIGSVGSGSDHFIPGLAVNANTAGSSAQLGLTYYYYPSAACDISTCQLDVGFISSGNGGTSWSAPHQIAGPMTPSWLATTDQGVMVGDYISTSFSHGLAVPAFAVANPPNGSVLDESMRSATMKASGGGVPASLITLRTDVRTKFLTASAANRKRVIRIP